MKHLRAIAGSLVYIFLNYLVAYIPCWHIRKLFYLLFGMKIGKGSRINMKCTVWDPWKIRIGKDTIINEWALLDGRGGLEIGDSTSVAMWAIIYTASHYASSPEFEYFTRPTKIGDCCWICARVVILPGSVLADRTIVSANSVYKGKSEESGIYAGVPATFVRHRAVEDNYVRSWVTHLR